jgi:hypothetical protein
MAKGKADHDRCVMMVGDPSGEWVQEMVRLAQEYQVEAVPCESVYAAVARTAATGRRALIIGKMRDLARGNGDLFVFAAAHDLRCCCLLEKDVLPGREGIRAALRAGVSLLFEVREARPILEDWLAVGARRTAGSARGLPEEDLRATAAELRALLGPQSEA